MSIVSTEIKENLLEATISSSPEIFDEYFLRYLTIACRNVKIKGFRPGKAPFEIAKDYVNNSWVNENAFKQIINHTVQEIVKSEEFLKLELFAEPVKQEVVEFKSDEKVLIFKSYFETKPIVNITDYSKIETLFQYKDLKNIYWLENKEDGKIEDNSVLYLKMVAKNKDGQIIPKYNINFYECDLEITKLKKELISEIKTCKVGENKEFKINIDKEEINFFVSLLRVLSKCEINDELVKKLSIETIEKKEDLIEKQKAKFIKHNEDIDNLAIMGWINKKEHDLSYIPVHNISVESRKTLDQLIQAKRVNRNNQQMLEHLINEIFMENVQKIKIACVLEKVAESAKISSSKKEEEEFMKKITASNNQMQIDAIDEAIKEDQKVLEGLVKQEKAYKLLKEKIIFSN